MGYKRGSDLNENGRNEASDNALESPSAAELISIKRSDGIGYLGEGSATIHITPTGCRVLIGDIGIRSQLVCYIFSYFI